MHAHRNFWKAAAVGCYWTNAAYPSAVVNTTSCGDGSQSGYAATLDYVKVGIFPTRQLAQQAVEQSARLRSWGVPARKRTTARS